MSIYYDREIPGELWLRDLKNNVDSASNMLSSIILKYENINYDFYYYLNTNQITRFDLFYDTFFIETPSGYIFEKFYIESGSIFPFNKINLFNQRKTTSVDYWYSEAKNKIYFTEIFFNPVVTVEENSISFVLYFKVFDCTTGLGSNLLTNQIKLFFDTIDNWDRYSAVFENPKLTYNPDTKKFNVSFILRNAANTLSLVSINILNKDNPEIIEINSFIPFIHTSKQSSLSSCVLPY
jgi:hypothetical protein